MVTATQTDQLFYIIYSSLRELIQPSLCSDMARMCMVDQRLLQMQLEAVQTMRALLIEKALMVTCDQ